jgi:hypothetical protein
MEPWVVIDDCHEFSPSRVHAPRIPRERVAEIWTFSANRTKSTRDVAFVFCITRQRWIWSVTSLIRLVERHHIELQRQTVLAPLGTCGGHDGWPRGTQLQVSLQAKVIEHVRQPIRRERHGAIHHLKV